MDISPVFRAIEEVGMRRQRFPVMLSEEERRILRALAEAEGLSRAAIVRRLLLLEARRHRLWPPPDAEADEARSEVDHG